MEIQSLKTKLRIFNGNIKAVLLYGAENSRVAKQITDRVLGICQQMPAIHPRQQTASWIIRNEDLWEITIQERMTNQLRRRKWRCIGHTHRNLRGCVIRQALF